ncbi:hypothetical protein CYK80_04150 [Clostridium perfringens]|uniref:Response regulatory domain-containing protein n=1 Tax=Clostridium perfringens TaxID=1502 RepID=A0AB37C1W6_CLOPF|nr:MULTISPECIES: hypothetical protein [Clostridium]ASY51663.1 hypothetical protein BG908_08335 [Clostridium perfringens]AWS26177.1 hypothetical protein CYK96_11315 [Clostridium perfringens]EJT6533446.1 hypothetical protein [Clostridium perfringens]MBS4958047.1 hypothetical protein [Clostridium sp.]MDH2459559.1 hypothetical protein [Clostridium perfringens]
MELNLLILDDDTMITESYKKSVNAFNLISSEYQFNCFISNTLSDALYLLTTKNINYAIVDLKLTNKQDGETGNQLIEAILSSFTIPTTIISGFTNDLKVDIEKIDFIKIIDRAEANINDVLNEFCNLEKCGLTTVFSKDGKLNKIISNLFWNYISVDLINSNYDITEDSLIRFTANYIKEYFTYDTNGMDLCVKPYEFYIMPPSSDKIQCGTILKYDECNYINLTPACDISNDKTDYYQLIKIDSFENSRSILKEIFKSKREDKRQVAIRKLTSNSDALKYHFLPRYKNFPGGLINFQTVVSINKNDLKECYCYGNVTGDFLKDITARFGMYFSRQGQPSLSDLKIISDDLEQYINE